MLSPSQMSKSRTINTEAVWTSVILGIVAGLIISGLAAFFTGAGHGWSSGGISFLSILGAPLSAVSWTIRGNRVSKTLGSIALLIGLVTDAWLWIATVDEGTNYLGKVWDAMPSLLLL